MRGDPPKSGFFDLYEAKPCTHPQHNPPMHLFIPPGKGYRHVCPECGSEVIMRGSQVTYSRTCGGWPPVLGGGMGHVG